MKVLIVAGGYLPNHKYGGPVRSLAAIVDQLGDEISFSVVTNAVDLGESHPYPGVTLDTWTSVGKADVWYMSRSHLSLQFWRRVISETTPDVIYLNSLMWPVSSCLLFWRKFGFLPRIPVILAPRGELAASALLIKSRKKLWFLRVARAIRLHEGLLWQASSVAEASDIQRVVGKRANIYIAPDLVIATCSAQPADVKQVGIANMCWLGRIAPVKNLTGALTFLRTVESGHISLSAYGPVEVEEYWQDVQDEADNLPDYVIFEHHGPLAHADVESALRRHQFFFFPTFGENFGHVIAEALNQGLPVIVSDQTPWRNLESAGVGWDIPLNDTERWTEIIKYCIEMDDEEYQTMSARCRSYVDIWMEEHGGRQSNMDMFELAFRQTKGS